MSNYVNQHELRVVGMSRSGNHAILNWIYRQASGQTCFLNCVEPKTNPFETARPMDDGRRAWTTDSQLPLEQQAAGKLSRKDWLIYSYEDCFLGMLVHDEFERHREQHLGRSQHQRDVLILRDAPNLFASRLRAKYGQISASTAIRIWKQHAREFLARRRYLPPDRIAICFNRWSTDREYRQQIARELGLEFTDAGFEEVTATGGGSSFDGRKYSGRASKMKVHQRWKRFVDDEQYLSILDREVLQLSEEIFGVSEASQSLMQRLDPSASAS